MKRGGLAKRVRRWNSERGLYDENYKSVTDAARKNFLTPHGMTHRLQQCRDHGRTYDGYIYEYAERREAEKGRG